MSILGGLTLFEDGQQFGWTITQYIMLCLLSCQISSVILQRVHEDQSFSRLAQLNSQTAIQLSCSYIAESHSATSLAMAMEPFSFWLWSLANGYGFQLYSQTQPNFLLILCICRQTLFKKLVIFFNLQCKNRQTLFSLHNG